MPTNTKFSQRNSAAGKMTGSQVAMGVATGKMSAKDVANAMGKPAKGSSSSTKTSTATKTSGSNVKPSTTKTTATKSMKTQNIPEVTVSVTKKTGTTPKPVTPPVKEKGAVNTNKYVQRTAGGEYIELTPEEHSKAVALQKSGKSPKGSSIQTLKESQYKESKNRILPAGSKVVMMGGQETVLNPSQYANYMSKRKTK